MRAALIESLIAQKKRCAGDKPHAPSCRRCARGNAVAAAATKAKASK